MYDEQTLSPSSHDAGIVGDAGTVSDAGPGGTVGDTGTASDARTVTVPDAGPGGTVRDAGTGAKLDAGVLWPGGCKESVGTSKM